MSRDPYVETRLAFADRPDVRLRTEQLPTGATRVHLREPPVGRTGARVRGGLGGVYLPYEIAGALDVAPGLPDEEVTAAARKLRGRYDRHLHEIVPHDPYRGAETFYERHPAAPPRARGSYSELVG